MAQRQWKHADWVMWVGARQWKGQPGEFDVGQVGFVYSPGDSVGSFHFVPTLGSGSAWSYAVACEVEDFLGFTTLENA